MELQQCIHDDPLIFEEEHQQDGAEVSCYGCNQTISGPCYFCRKCNHFFLHKVCAELPKKMENPKHPQHPLDLLSRPPCSQSSSDQLPCECGVCGQPCKSFTYSCSLCEFNVDVMCALMEHKIEHKFHDHLLTPLLRPTLFLCDACGARHEGTSYKCRTCKFWVNQKCASLPSTMDRSEYHVHKHPLSLTYSFPYERFRFTAYCKVCFKEIERGNWAYVCVDCKYFAHVNCLTKPQPRRKPLSAPRPPPLPPPLGRLADLFLPLPEESISLTTHFMKKFQKSERSTKIDHVRHHHLLFFVEKHINDESSASGKPIACSVCAQPVLAPYYHCFKCKFTLHECCAKIPIELQHPIHSDHPLLLNRWRSKYPGPPGLLPICQVCNMSCNGVSYGCVACDFFLDFYCASLLGTIKHRAHRHVLTLQEATDVLCSACHETFSGVGLVCKICEFGLHTRCALLPLATHNKYDRHAFSLLYFGTDDDYYCEICEKEINLNCWFYNCDDCRRSLHTKCIRLVSSLPQHVITHEAHVHTLALQKTSTVRCAACKHKCYGFGYVCEKNCKFTLHTRCASLPQTVEHRYDKHLYFLKYSAEHVKQGYWYCEICGIAINVDCWFYSCGDCNKYLHPLCVQFVDKKKLKIRDKVSLGVHQHLLTVVEHPKDINPCNICGELVKDWCLQCAQCTFVLHKSCAYNAANKLIALLQKDGKLEPQQYTARRNANPKMIESTIRDVKETSAGANSSLAVG
ncbi:hypothetical protein Vadar_013638 [Vaccinium darrowii]|uniref:Uncharacterized protein n=1 Tax=Vaccinium darrowii TaxID=229202 RepID=A0ACB7YUZ2_9ERIC|nr:hypothetical protein Vadar_013638 [Vaccinium darrowii]